MADLNPVIGSEQANCRPVLVISDETVNQILPVVTVLPITKRKGKRKIYPNEVLLTKDAAGLDKESIILAYQIRTLDKKRLTKHLGTINSTKIKQLIIDALSIQLGIHGVLLEDDEE